MVLLSDNLGTNYASMHAAGRRFAEEAACKAINPLIGPHTLRPIKPPG